jgi:hypothetical protein
MCLALSPGHLTSLKDLDANMPTCFESLLNEHDQEGMTQVKDWVSRTEYGDYVVDTQIATLVPNRPSG